MRAAMEIGDRCVRRTDLMDDRDTVIRRLRLRVPITIHLTTRRIRIMDMERFRCPSRSDLDGDLDMGGDLVDLGDN